MVSVSCQKKERTHNALIVSNSHEIAVFIAPGHGVVAVAEAAMWSQIHDLLVQHYKLVVKSRRDETLTFFSG